MWKRIEDARRNSHVIELRPWMRWAVAAAAVLILGIGIGRWTANRRDVTTGGSTPGAAVPGSSGALIYQNPPTQDLSRPESFLASFRTDARGGASPAPPADAAGAGPAARTRVYDRTARRARGRTRGRRAGTGYGPAGY